MMKARFFAAASFVFLVSVSVLMAEVSLPSIMASDMVLQRGQAVPIWGWAKSGETVTVEFAGQKKSTTADKAGNWMVKLDPMEASAESRELKISGITLKNILVGDVWICSGQSNMEYGFRGNGNELKNDKVRMFHVHDHIQSGFAMEDTNGSWASFGDGNSRRFSGVGLYFGLKLQRELGIPIGLIDTSWGGTRIEPWIADEGYELMGKPLAKADMADVIKQQNKIISDVETWLVRAKERAEAGKVTPFTAKTSLGGKAPNGIYNAMVAPLAPFGIKGAIWYQGESNRGSAFPDYFHKLQGLIGGWRKKFEVPDFPFYIVQIAPFDYSRGKRGPHDVTLCDNIWAAEYKAAKEIVNCGVIPTHDTIKGNISYGKPEATDEEIIEAAKAAQIHEYIMTLPKGYETMVGERGVTLSGGQRQRVSIARTLLTDPRILILDDSTSNVDAHTESLIQLAIEKLRENRTALIITQRASTCETADRVVVMDKGRIIAEGKHRELLKTSPEYMHLIESQALNMNTGGDD